MKITERFNLGDNKVGKSIVYGVYDNSREPITVRINDYLIDHSPVTLKEKSYLFHLLGVMIDSGMSIIEALGVIAERFENERLRRILCTLKDEVSKGRALSDGMAEFSDVFDESEIGIVKSGEAVGHLDKMLFKLSVQLEKLYETKLKLRSALVYPSTVLITLFLSVGVIIVFVLPKLLKIFTEAGQDLPFLTKFLLLISSFFNNYFGFIIAFVIISIFMFRAYAKSEYGKFKIDYLKLRLPILGPLLRNGELIKFISLFGILNDSGLPMNRTMKILSNSMSNHIYNEKIADVAMAVERGEKLSASLSDAKLLFPSTVVQMIAVGERSATLAMVCEKISSQYEKELDHSIKNLITILEPLVIFLVGILVAIMAYAVLGPIFNLSQIM